MTRIVVYYHQHWLPDLEGVIEENNLYNVKSFREIEVILEPQVLFLCLLRKFCRIEIVFKPCLYDRFYDGILPASLVSVKYTKPNSSTNGYNNDNTDNNNNVTNKDNSNCNSNNNTTSNTTNSDSLDNNNDSNTDSHDHNQLQDKEHQNNLHKSASYNDRLKNLHFNYGNDDYSCCVLRNEELINYLIKSSNYANDINTIELESEFALYNKNDNKYNRDNKNKDNRDNKTNEYNMKYLKNDVVIVSYIYNHLRYSILYLIWLHPVLNRYTFQVVVNSEPVPYAYYSFLKKKLQVKNQCDQYGYSNLEHTLRDLRFMLQGLRMIILNGFYNNYPLSDIFWFEGYVFSNLSVLFSLPCEDLDELLSLHKEFNDLKSYCVKMNSRYEVVSLKPPFLSGDEMPISDFKNSLLSNMINYVV